MHQREPIGVADAARILGYSIAHTKRLALKGDVPTIGKLPGRTGAYLFDRAAVEALAAERAA